MTVWSEAAAAGARVRALESSRRPLEEVFLETLAGMGVHSLFLPSLVDALPEDGERRVDLPLLSLVQDDKEHLPHVLDRLEMLPPVAEHVHGAHQAPRLQLPDTAADVGARHAQGGGDFTDVEIARAVAFMANNGGGKFEEPKAPAAEGDKK